MHKDPPHAPGKPAGFCPTRSGLFESLRAVPTNSRAVPVQSRRRWPRVSVLDGRDGDESWPQLSVSATTFIITVALTSSQGKASDFPLFCRPWKNRVSCLVEQGRKARHVSQCKVPETLNSPYLIRLQTQQTVPLTPDKAPDTWQTAPHKTPPAWPTACSSLLL